MSLYYTEKLLYKLNRSPELREQFAKDCEAVLAAYKLTAEESNALKQPDIGLLYVLGVNGQLLMHYAGLFRYSWPEYLDLLRAGVEKHGPVRAGLYTMKDGKGAV